MDFALGIAGNIADKIIDYTIAPIGHQLGYLVHYSRNIDDLRAQIVSLKIVKDGVERRVIAAERNGDVIRSYVKDWIEEANKIEHLVDNEVNGNHRCSFGSCPNLVLRYKVSRNSNKKKMDVDELISRGNQIDTVSDPAPTPTIRAMYPADAGDFESRKKIINDVMEAIKDDKYNVIGVHGMGGVGKTTLVTEVAKIAEKYKLFEEMTPVVAVSQSPSIMKIQHEIAKRLGMTLDENEDMRTRAARLHDRLRQVRSILVILDDLWDELKLEDIGIPRPSVHKGCKILLTTRNRHVCNQMGSQRDFPIEVLSELEAWKLFKEKAGDDIVDSPYLHDIATKVAKECAGLPLAIVTVAGALMKNKDPSEWKDALRQLQNPSPKRIDGMTAEVYKSLQLSYDSLKAEGLKDCLLLCCLAPEDSNIMVSELVRLAMGLRLFSGVCKFEDVRDAVRASISKLKARSLLLDGTIKNVECVRMHDMVRDFAISIASESKCGIWARIDFGRSEWSDSSDTTIALLNKFHQLPAQIGGPKLKLLLLQDCDWTLSTVIPEMYFKEMTELSVLSVFCMRIPKAPSSLQYLVKLQTLRLEYCSIEDLPCITELKGLEILSLSGSKIIELPREIGQLTQLRNLDLSNCTVLTRIPAGVLSRLSRLEGLYMDNCSFNRWGEGDSASLDELKGMSYLSDLNMHLKNAEHFPQDIQLQRLSEFKFNLGEECFYAVEEYFPKTLILSKYSDKRVASHQGVKMLLNKAEYLILQETEDVECFLSDIKREGFSTLKRLRICRDSTVEYLADTTKLEGVMTLPHNKIFPVLETLDLVGMSNLKEICHGQLPAGSFCELRQLSVHRLDSLEDLWVLGNNASLPNLIKVYVYKCPKLKKLINICSQNIANGFGQQLHEILIEYCPNLEEIFTNDIVGVEEEAIIPVVLVDEIMLPKLRFLKLEELPNLATFCSKRSRVILQQAFFPEKIVFPNLNMLVVSGSFEEIWPPRIPDNNFCRLTDLEITGCDKLKIAIPYNMVQRLQNSLKRFVIKACKMMKEIVANTELGGADQEEEQLQTLKLTYSHHGSSALEFPSLEELSIQKCPNIETIVARIEKANPNDMAQGFFNEKILFPKLKTLKVGGNFEQIQSPQVEIHLAELRVLIIDGCQKLKKVIPYNLAKSLHALEEMTVKNCDLVDEVVEEVLGESVNGERISFPRLRKVNICNCGGLRHLFSHSQAKLYFNQLQELDISSCEKMIEILVKESAEEEEDKSSFLLFPQLETLRFFNLQELTCFYHGLYSLEFASLKNLTIENCPKMATVPLDDDVMVNSLLTEKIVLPKLEWLEVSGGNFEHIWPPLIEIHLAKNFSVLRVLEIDESVHGERILFPRLRKVWIKNCGGLRHLFSHSQAKLYFNQLQELVISSCEIMKEIVVKESAEDEEDKSSFLQLDYLILSDMQELTCFYNGHYTLEFPSLKKLKIENCPKMETIALDDDVMVHSLFDEKVLLPTLSELEIVSLKCIKKIWYKQLPAKSFCQLSILKVISCDSLRNLLTPSIVEGLSSLRWIIIRECSILEEVLVDATEEEQRIVQVSDLQDKVIVFPHVITLYLESLPNLRSFYSGRLILEFPSLEYFHMADCPQMQTFSSGLVISPKPHTMSINRRSNEDSWKGDLNSSIQHLFQEKVIHSAVE